MKISKAKLIMLKINLKVKTEILASTYHSAPFSALSTLATVALLSVPKVHYNPSLPRDLVHTVPSDWNAIHFA